MSAGSLEACCCCCICQGSASGNGICLSNLHNSNAAAALTADAAVIRAGSGIARKALCMSFQVVLHVVHSMLWLS
jgi:hypothetical protein